MNDHVVYTIRNKAGRALYVGMTTNLAARLVAHRAKPWYPAHPVVEQTEPMTYTDAFFMERRLIWQLQPDHNQTLRRPFHVDPSLVPEGTAMFMIGQPNAHTWRRQIFAGFDVVPAVPDQVCDQYAYDDVETVARALGVAATPPRRRGQVPAPDPAPLPPGSGADDCSPFGIPRPEAVA